MTASVDLTSAEDVRTRRMRQVGATGSEEGQGSVLQLPRVRRASVAESSDYSRSVAGIDIDVIRTGEGVAPTQIHGAVAPKWSGSSITVGFPVFTRTTLDARPLAIAVIEHAPPGMSWCGIDLSAGDVLVYSPEANHVARHPIGARFSFAVFDADDLLAIADRLQSSITVTKGSVKRAPSTAGTRLVQALLPHRVRGEESASVLDLPRDGLPELAAAMLASGADTGRQRSRKLDNRVIVHTSIACAEKLNRIPTIDELCASSHVCERRLHAAFTETHDVPPHQFFMKWALDVARRRLIASDPAKVTVSWIAVGTGFNHLGRFARYYRKTYGESPSETLRRASAE